MSLRTDNLKKIYGNREVVKGMNIEIENGEIVALLGKNGAGKTTTFKMILGVVKPDSGDIVFEGNIITQLPPDKRAEIGITYLPQEPSVFKKASVADNFRIIMEENGYGKKDMDDKIDELLREFDIEKLKDSMAYTLSGGERRRVEIARALIINPLYFLLDEPFSGVDPLTIVELQKLIKYLSSKNIGILISDHNVHDTFDIATRVYIIEEGVVIAEGTPEEIAYNPIAKEKFLGKDFIF
jgi:lipopolysaccharide export system ATP-binding protein